MKNPVGTHTRFLVLNWIIKTKVNSYHFIKTTFYVGVRCNECQLPATSVAWDCYIGVCHGVIFNPHNLSRKPLFIENILYLKNY